MLSKVISQTELCLIRRCFSSPSQAATTFSSKQDNAKCFPELLVHASVDDGIENRVRVMHPFCHHNGFGRNASRTKSVHYVYNEEWSPTDDKRAHYNG